AVLPGGEPLAEALEAILSSAAVTTGADVAIARVLEPATGSLVARSCATASAALATEVEGTRFPVDQLTEDEVSVLEELPPAARRIAERAGATAVLQIPLRLSGRTLGALELFRRGKPFDESERALGRLAASQAALSIAALEWAPLGGGGGAAAALALAADALAAGLADGAAGAAVARLALEASGAAACRLWQEEGGDLRVATAPTTVTPDPSASAAAAEALAGRETVRVEEQPGGRTMVTLQLGRPPTGLLELVFAEA